MTADFKSVIQI